ncbi:T9SS type A sorting domain-containing protein [uncultured Winogradskyella sp.]|uniref:T9SS type A sorting domain-containing protein n=1 Tax=uncultured Winogradskyella sp. TaxID=395353 RepID=UPI00262E4BD8|nr:T9SS type A sorting domain-containing protein [uncultured Winogradskyella sp.]
MHIILFVFILFFSILSYGQSENLVDITWRCTNIVINGDIIEAPSNDEVVRVVLQMIQDNDTDTDDFASNVCNSFTSSDGIVTYNDPEPTFSVSAFTQTLSICGYAENDFFENNYFGFFYDNTNIPLSYDINNVNDLNTLTITAANGDTANYEEFVLSIKDNSLKQTSISPNPAKEKININSNINIIDKVEIYSITGRIIKSLNQPNSAIDISNISEGIYIIKIFSSNSFIIKRFVKN